LAITATAEARAIKAAAPCKAGQVKANRNTGVYHLPGMRYYAQLSDNVGCFDTAGQAEAAGFRLSEK
jgi:methylphosphotriester-DNA--protein-cysteine methyltransferase